MEVVASVDSVAVWETVPASGVIVLAGSVEVHVASAVLVSPPERVGSARSVSVKSPSASGSLPFLVYISILIGVPSGMREPVQLRIVREPVVKLHL